MSSADAWTTLGRRAGMQSTGGAIVTVTCLLGSQKTHCLAVCTFAPVFGYDQITWPQVTIALLTAIGGVSQTACVQPSTFGEWKCVLLITMPGHRANLGPPWKSHAILKTWSSKNCSCWWYPWVAFGSRLQLYREVKENAQPQSHTLIKNEAPDEEWGSGIPVFDLQLQCPPHTVVLFCFVFKDLQEG